MAASKHRPQHRLDTRLVHAGEPSPRLAGAVVAPIFQSATFLYAGGDDVLATPRTAFRNRALTEEIRGTVTLE